MEPEDGVLSQLPYLPNLNETKKKYHPINPRRYRHKHFYTLCKPLREYPLKFFIYFRMLVSSFDELLSCVKYHLRKFHTYMKAAITSDEMLVITIK